MARHATAGRVAAVARWGGWSRTAVHVARAGCRLVSRLVLLVWAAAVTLAACRGEAHAQTAASERTETWHVVCFDGKRAGYVRTTSWWEQRDGQRVFVTSEKTTFAVRRFGQPLRLERHWYSEETEDGQLLRFVFELKNPPASTTRMTGTVQPRLDGSRRLEVEMTVAGRKTHRTLDWPPDAKSPAYQDRLLEKEPLRPGDRRSFKAFLPELLQFTDVKLVADDYRPVRLLDGRTVQALKVRVTQTVLPTSETRVYLDEHGRAVKTETDLLGMKMETFLVSEREALKTVVAPELDVTLKSSVYVGRITGLRRARRAVYRVRVAGGDPVALLPQDDSQRVVRVSKDTADVTVVRVPVPVHVRPSAAPAEYLRSTQYLQADDPRVQEHARRAAGGLTDPGLIALRMEKYVHDHLVKKNFSVMMASAAEVAEKLEGDCTEHAVLLAAMLRAAKVPSRVAVGLVYVDELKAFAGHMWTEAFLDGHWVPLDATLGQGGTGPDRLKLAVSSLDEAAPSPVKGFLSLADVLGKIEISVQKVER